MARKELMNWEGAPNYRWYKTHNGKLYRVTADELGFHDEDRTKAKTTDAANAWWQAKLLSLKPKERKKKNVDDQNPFFGVNKWGEVSFLPAMYPSLYTQVEQRIENDPNFSSKVRQILEPSPAGSSVDHWTKAYLDTKRLDGNRSPARYDNLQRSIRRLRDHIGVEEPITALNWSTWDSFVLSLHKTKLGDVSKRDVVADCREFVRWLERRNVIESVKNISETRIKVSAKKIEHFTKAELRRILSASTGLLRTFLLLFCNCGFRQIDVATLTSEMVNEKYLTRQRAKSTGTNAPTISWILWQETIEAMNEFRNESGLLFTRSNDLPWVVEGLNENNTRKRDDAFRRELWIDFSKANKIRLSSNAIRASCANLLKTDSEITNQLSVQIKYLGQCPSGVALRHYIDPPQKELDAAVMRLRRLLLA